ncbi:MAG TPA: sugar transferase [Vicinamibacterales bacterium]|nr:sugar transferase [Vicinamibacterales bacterium]
MSRPRTRPNKRREPPRPLSEELFKGLLTKERKRADRSNQTFLLLVVELADRADARDPSIWVPVIEALTAVTRETDVLGWFEWRTAIGVILPEVGALDTIRMSDLEARFSRELVRRSDQTTASRLTVRLHLHADARRTPAGAVPDDDAHPIVYDLIKRGIDIAGSAILLALLAPLFVLIAVAIKLKSEGPVFFRQERIGRKMKPFRMLKFRTMYAGADHRIHHEYVTQFITSNARADAGDGAGVFKLTADPRVTPIGRILRKTSLDELPQLVNVLRGEMSLVGPRPPLAYELEQYKPWHCHRVIDAKPGITGLWQVTGRSRTTFDEMVRLDLRHARTHSIWADIKILLATPRAVLSGRGAC